MENELIPTDLRTLTDEELAPLLEAVPYIRRYCEYITIFRQCQASGKRLGWFAIRRVYGLKEDRAKRAYRVIRDVRKITSRETPPAPPEPDEL